MINKATWQAKQQNNRQIGKNRTICARRIFIPAK